MVRTIGRVGTPVTRFIESLGLPVMLLDSALQVAGASPEMTSLLPASRHEGGGIGAVFECGEADTRGDCGRSIHCSGCAIRRAVVHTFETGEPQARVPATLTREAADSAEDIRMYITTEKVGEQVLLRVDPVE